MLDSLFNPRTIAVVGASRSPDKVGNFILANLINGGYAGRLVPVNKEADEILGLQCVSRLTLFSGQIDLSIVVVPRSQVKVAVSDSIEAGAKAVVVISVGFKESGGEGLELEEQIAGMCQLRQVRLLGPNCLGLINTENRINAFYAQHMPKTGGISMLSQSSAICAAFLDRLASTQLGVAKVVNLGNKADLSEIDLLRALAHDPQTKVIIGYLESITSGDAFVKAAEEASAQKPVIILKSATTDAGRRAVAAHTGEVIATDTAYGAAFKRAGVVRAKTFAGLFDFAAAFSLQPLPEGNRVLVISNAGGPGVMAVDAIEQAGLHVTYLESVNVDRLRQSLSETATVYNPVDLLGDAGPDSYRVAIKTAMCDQKVDAVVVIFVGRMTSKPVETAKAIVESCNGQKPVMVSFLGTGDEARALLRPGGVPDYDSPEHAVAALKAMWDYVCWRNRPPRVVTRFKVNRRRVERIIHRRLRNRRPEIIDVSAKNILAAYDFQIPKGETAYLVEDAIEAAEQIGYPVAMKIISVDIINKSDLGGVRLNITSREAVRDAYDLMMLRVRQQAPHAIIEGVYIEKMLERGLEVVLGMERDPQFGPMLMFGLGGIFVEVLKDVAFHLAPITFEEAAQMLTGSKSYQKLLSSGGIKGTDDLQIIVHCLQKISQLSTDFPQISNLEINPLIVGEHGGEAYVADARIRLRGHEL